MLLTINKNNSKKESRKYKKFTQKEEMALLKRKTCLSKWQNLFECLNNSDFT
jgi:hypothetical protein